MSLKKLLAAGVAVATLSTLVTPAASAASSDNTTYTWAENEKFQQGEAGSSLTGSSPLDLGLIIGGSIAAALAALKLAVDNVPALRAQVDQFAAQVGSSVPAA